ncbi:MAG: metal-dependent hydrolase [Candidatus Aenigmatarchaeota archaeon]
MFSCLIDLDHFIGVERASFHNIFVTILFPLAIIFLAFNFKSKYNFKGFSILLLVFLSSHTFIDMFGNPGIALFYPLSNNYYLLNFELSVPLKTNFSKSLEEGYIVSNLGLSILLYFILIILPCLFLDDIIEIMEKKHESFKKVIKEKFKFLILLLI